MALKTEQKRSMHPRDLEKDMAGLDLNGLGLLEFLKFSGRNPCKTQQLGWMKGDWDAGMKHQSGAGYCSCQYENKCPFVG